MFTQTSKLDIMKKQNSFHAYFLQLLRLHVIVVSIHFTHFNFYNTVQFKIDLKEGNKPHRCPEVPSGLIEIA